MPAHYTKLISLLEVERFHVVCPRWPSCNDASPPNKTLDDDVRCARQEAVKLLETGHDIVALMHSYGGVVGGSALANLRPTRHASGTQPGQVRALIYMTAFIPFEDQSLAAMFGGQLPPFLVSNPETKVVDIDDPASHFYNDLSKEEADKWVKALVQHPTVCQYEGIQDAALKQEIGGRMAWRDAARVVYIKCMKDAGLPHFVQQMMVDRIETEGGIGKGTVNIEVLESSHSPFLSMPEKVVEIVKKFT